MIFIISSLVYYVVHLSSLLLEKANKIKKAKRQGLKVDLIIYLSHMHKKVEAKRQKTARGGLFYVPS